MDKVIQLRLLHCCTFILLLFPLSLPADVLVVTGKKSTLDTLDKNQVRDIFLGKVSSLPNIGNVTPIDQPGLSPLREEFYSKIAHKSAAQAKAHWAKLHFTGRGIPPHESTNSSEVKKILNSRPGAIGYIESAELDSSVKVVFAPN